MFDDLIPAPPPGYVLDSPPAKPGMFDDIIPPLPPGYVLDQPTATQPKLVPVDHDLFAAPPPGEKLVSVDHNPFAVSAARADSPNAGVNVALAGTDYLSSKVGGPKIAYRVPMASDAIAANASNIAKGVSEGRRP